MEEKLKKAIAKCNDKNNTISLSQLKKIYSFTNENIKGYIDFFPLKDKSLLTVGSSCDEAINANFNSASNITIMDTCPFTKEYFYLKKAALEIFTRQEFLDYFCSFNNAGNTFSLEKYQQLQRYLETLDKASYNFWNELYKRFPGSLIKDKLFRHDEEDRATIEKINLYLQSDEAYLKERENIRNFTPTIISKSINEPLSQKFDNIFLSNTSIHMQTKQMVDTYLEKIAHNLNYNGKILIRYIYHCKDDKKLDIEKFFYSYFDDLVYDFDNELIPSVDEEMSDGIITYQKKK